MHPKELPLCDTRSACNNAIQDFLSWLTSFAAKLAGDTLMLSKSLANRDRNIIRDLSPIPKYYIIELNFHWLKFIARESSLDCLIP